MPDTVNLRDQATGRTFAVPPDKVYAYKAQGFREETPEEGIDRQAGETFHEQHGGVGGAIGSAVAGGLSGLTLGLSDQALGALGADRTLRHMEAEHPYATGAGVLGGALLPTVLTGGAAAAEEGAGIGARILARSPAALASKVGRGVAELGEGAGLAGRLAAGTAGAAAEGALYGGGQYLTETALEDKPLSAGGFVAGMGHGALFAAPIGAAGTLASATLQRARSLFPRSEVSAAAAAGVKEQASGALAQAVRDGDTMAAAAERKLSDVDARTGIAQSGESVTRRVFGEAHPQAMADQVTGAVDRQAVTQALDGYQQARQQFDEWLSTEADPDLETLLRGTEPAGELHPMLGPHPTLRSFRGDPQVDAAMRATLDRADVVGSGGVPVGEFGAPGSGGIKSPEELQRALEGSVPEAAPVALAADQPATAVLRGGAKGTPVGVPAQEIVQRGMADEGTAVGRRPAAAAAGAAAAAQAPATDSLTGLLRGTQDRLAGGESLGAMGAPARATAPADHGLVVDAWLGNRDVVWKDAAHEAEASPPIWEPKKNSKRVAAAQKAASASVERRKEIYSAVAGNLPHELQSTWEVEGYKFLQEEAARIRGVKDPINAASKISEAFSEKYGSGSETLRGYEGDRYHRRAEIEAEHAEAWANEQERKHYASMMRDEESRAPKAKHAKSVAEPTPEPPRAKAFGSLSDPGTRQQLVEFRDSYRAKKQLIDDAIDQTKLSAKAKQALKNDLHERAEKLIGMIGERPAAVEPAAAAPAPSGIPSYEHLKAQPDPVVTTVPASTIKERGWYELPGQGEDTVKAERGRAAIKEGQKTPIDITVGRDGKLFVSEGRNRLAAAVEQDAPIKVRWDHGVAGSEGEVFKGGSATTSGAGDDLLAALSGTKAAIGRGESFTAVGRAPAAAARAEQLLRHPETAERFMAKAGAADAAQALRGRALKARAAAEPEVGDATMGRILAKHGIGGAPTPAAAAAEPDALAARILRNESRPSAIAATAPVSDAAVAGEGKLEPMTKAEIVEQRTRFRAIAPEQRAAKAILRHNGKGADMGPGLARAAKAIGDMEEASAKLTDVLGPEAPPGAVENAKVYRAAIGAQNERAAASSAKTAADLQTKAQPAADATVVDDDVAKALRRHESRTAARAPAAAAAAPAASAGTAAGGIGGRLADAGAALEVLRAIGAHVPAVSHIPVIGPVLGLFFKARAVMSILGRKGGSIGKSTESVIAATSAATRERIVAATGALLEGGARAAGKASHLAGPAALLGGMLFPGGDKAASDKPRDLFEARSSEITRAMQPGAVDQAIAQRFPTSDPAMHDAIVAQVQRGIAFLDSKRPKQTVLPGVLPGDGTWRTSMASIDEFGKFVHAVNDPISVLEDLAKGHPSAEGAETLRTVYPELYQYAQKELLKAAPEMAKTLPYSRRVMLSILYQIPVDGTMQPSHAQYLQVPAPPLASPKTPPSTGPLRLGQQTLSPLDQRAGV